jgi:RNA polymerase sigma-70 factor (ECF subfamily)
VDDVLQQTFVAAFRCIRQYEPRTSGHFHAWLRAIADHRIQDALRSERRKKRGGGQTILHGSPDESSWRAIVELISGSTRSPSQSVAVREATQALQVALAGLPEDQRAAIRFRFLDGLSLDETALRMGRTSNAVRALVHRAKIALREAMGRSSRWFGNE